MPYEFKFPDVGEGIHEGELVKWQVKEGDLVNADQTLAEVETDKAVVEMPSPKKGTIARLHFKEGDVITVGQVFVTIALPGEDASFAKASSASSSATSSASSQAPPASKADKKDNGDEEKYTGSVVGFVEEAKEVSPIFGQGSSSGTSSSSQVQATLAVRKLASEKGVNLAAVKGTGAQGRITEQDVLAASQKEAVQSSGAAAQTSQASTSWQSRLSPPADTGKQKHVRKYDFYGYLERNQLKGIKKKVAEHMAQSFYTSPQVTNFHTADVTLLEKRREQKKTEGVHVTSLAYILRALGIALQKHPIINSYLEEGEVVMKKYYNVGIAVDTDDGLIVPVAKRVNTKTIEQLAEEIKKLSTEARERKINLMDLKGGSFTVSNLGMFGVEHFTPILNFPETALLGVGKTSDILSILEVDKSTGQARMGIKKKLPLSFTYDHCVISGADAARFMKDLVELLEKPQELEKAPQAPAGH